jgi:hypothetical protein
VLSVLQLPLDTLVFMLNRFTADDFSKEGIPAGGVQFLAWGCSRQQLHHQPAVHAHKHHTYLVQYLRTADGTLLVLTDILRKLSAGLKCVSVLECY